MHLPQVRTRLDCTYSQTREMPSDNWLRLSKLGQAA